MSVRIIHGDCREVLPTLPADSFDCVVMSPPYFGLRDYGVDGQIGLEPTLALYLETMVGVCRELRRALKPSGTFWLNIGDSYNAHPGQRKTTDKVGPKQLTNAGSNTAPSRHTPGLKPKDLIMVPNRLAILLQEPWHNGPIKSEIDRAWLAGLIDADGCIGIRHQQPDERWNPSYIPYLTVGCSDIALVEHCAKITGLGKVNVKSHAGDTDSRGIKQRRDGYVWRLDGQVASKVIRDIFPYLIQKRGQALLCNAMNVSQAETRENKQLRLAQTVVEYRHSLYENIKALNQRQAIDLPELPPVISNMEPGWYVRSEIIWHKPNPMPESVIDRPTCAHEKVWLLTKSERYFYDAQAIAEDAREGARRFNGGHDVGPDRQDNKRSDARGIEQRNARNVWPIAGEPYRGAHYAVMPSTLAERCIKAGCPIGGSVLDPFGGAGTTGLVADRLGRDATLIELNPANRELGAERVRMDGPLFAEVSA